MLMITTFTSTNSVNYLHQQPDLCNSELTDESASSFYESLKPELNKLVLDPSEESIRKILAYSAKKD
jgi:hypothetical protein